VEDQSQLTPNSFAITDKTLTLFMSLNVVATLSLVGFTYYTQFIYKKPIFSETTERARIEEQESTQKPSLKPTYIAFDSMTVNLLPSYQSHHKPEEQDESPDQKPHYITLGLSLEIRNEKQKALIEELKPLLIDELIQLLGRRTFEELITVQGRYVLNSKITEQMNQLIRKKAQLASQEPLITHAYFTQFIVQ
jgi:flagellar basal body-associated protein FliL